jgi:hypothetical protein
MIPYIPRPYSTKEFGARKHKLGSLYGLRAWRAVDTRLLPVTSAPYTWLTGTNTALCMTEQLSGRQQPDNHELIALNCGCGFWAYYTGRVLQHYPAGQTVMGIIEGFGRVVVGTLGFRCEYAIIRCLIAPETNSRVKDFPTLADHYQLPVYATAEAALRDWPLTDRSADMASPDITTIEETA